MNKTFELIKKAEQDGDTVIRSARERISNIKRELSEDIGKMEDRYYTQMNELRDTLQKEEQDSIHREQILMDQKWIEKTEAMKQSFSQEKEDFLLALIGKVMNTNGDSGC